MEVNELVKKREELSKDITNFIHDKVSNFLKDTKVEIKYMSVSIDTIKERGLGIVGYIIDTKVDLDI